MNWQDFDIRTVGGVGAGGILTALLIWVRGSKARRDVSRDSVEVREDESKKDWLDTLEARYRTEVALREASEARERITFRELQDATSRLKAVELQVAMLQEHNGRLHRRFARVLGEHRPDLAAWLESSPMDLGPVEFQPPAIPGKDRKP